VSGTADGQGRRQVVTSGIDGIYPKGFGHRSDRISHSGGGEYSAIVIRPAVDFRRSNRCSSCCRRRLLRPPTARDGGIGTGNRE